MKQRASAFPGAPPLEPQAFATLRLLASEVGREEQLEELGLEVGQEVGLLIQQVAGDQRSDAANQRALGRARQRGGARAVGATVAKTGSEAINRGRAGARSRPGRQPPPRRRTPSARAAASTRKARAAASPALTSAAIRAGYRKRLRRIPEALEEDLLGSQQTVVSAVEVLVERGLR